MNHNGNTVSTFFTKPYILSVVVTFFLGISIGWYSQKIHTNLPVTSALRESDLNTKSEYTFIDPLLGLKNTFEVTPPEYKKLQLDILYFIKNQVNEGNLQTASVYFRDIKQSGGILINDTEKYSPASLLKVPTMIAYYKIAETDPEVLNQKIYYTQSKNLNTQEHIISPIQLEAGHSYSIETLIEHMIKYSDNNAATLLVNNLNATGHTDTFNNLFTDLGIDQVDLTDDFITIKAYSLFFRVLYNATYLSRSMSEKALSLMTESDFSKGIDAGVPNNIIVSQKFGEFTLQDPAGTLLKRELHNCGIIYYPHNPYLICIMTKGYDFPKLEGVIADISRITYESVEKRVHTEGTQ